MQIEVLPEISGQNQVRMHLQVARRVALLLHTEDLPVAVGCQHPQPHAGSAPEVEHGGRIDIPLENVGDDDRRVPDTGRQPLMFLQRERGKRVVHAVAPGRLVCRRQVNMGKTVLD